MQVAWSGAFRITIELRTQSNLHIAFLAGVLLPQAKVRLESCKTSVVLKTQKASFYSTLVASPQLYDGDHQERRWPNALPRAQKQ